MAVGPRDIIDQLLVKKYPDEKLGILDLRTELEGGILCNIEIQLANKGDIIDRILYYWSRAFSEQLKDGWWHGVKHGMALLGHAAPYAYLHGISTVYIASSHCPADGHVRCASNPLTDNHVRFANARVVHDGFECGRQDKVHDVVDYVNRTGNRLSLHVCWESQSGRNCCHCEKCYRTMASIMAECADPVDYGFDRTSETVSDMQRYIVGQKVLNANLATSGWKHIHNGVRRNKKTLKRTKYWKYLKWIDKADFDRYEDLKLPLLYRIRNKLSTLRFYQFLHEMKVKLRG